MKSLIEKYNRSAPRYTSYPPVPFWNDKIDQHSWLEHVRNHYDPAKGVDLYIHIPYCEKLCWYCGCNMVVSKNKGKGRDYVDYLLKEWSIYNNSIDNLKIHSIHFGGGTPTFLSADSMQRLVDRLAPAFNSDFIGAIEVDPRVCEENHFKLLAQAGFSRFSIGVQDFDPHVQKAINRIQSYQLVKETTEKARSYGFKSVNFDLIYGLPLQSKKSTFDTIKKVMRLKPDLIAYYSYAHLPDKIKHQKIIDDKNLLFGMDKFELFYSGKNYLEQEGFIPIGMDHFASKDSFLAQVANERKLKRNFMGYTDQKSEILIGLGASSIGETKSSFFQNPKDIKTYQEMVNKRLIIPSKSHLRSERDRQINDLIQDIMCNCFASISLLDQLEQKETIINQLRAMELDGILILDLKRNTLTVTARGRLLLRNIALVFDQYLSENITSKFSQTV